MRGPKSKRLNILYFTFTHYSYYIHIGDEKDVNSHPYRSTNLSSPICLNTFIKPLTDTHGSYKKFITEYLDA